MRLTSFQRAVTSSWLLVALVSTSTWAFSMVAKPQGSAARPLDKKKVAVVGAGGSMGSLTFGFLQRACSLYGTGLGDYRAIAACADTAKRLNSVLSKNFCLAFANEASIKLTDLTSPESLVARLEGWDALILGSDTAAGLRPVTMNTYESSPNDKCFELYWKKPPTLMRPDNEEEIVTEIFENILQAAKKAGVKHVVYVDEPEGTTKQGPALLESCGIPYTLIQSAGDLIAKPDYTYRVGVQGDLVLNKSNNDENNDFASAYEGMSYEEDVAALCVQCLMTLDWSKSRTIAVSTAGPLAPLKNPKRPDQEWCVNSVALAQLLGGIQ